MDDEGTAVSTLDETLTRALFAVAGELQITMASVPARASETGQIGVRESDLQRALCRALQAQLGSVASIEGPLPPAVKEHWSGRLGRADVVASLDSTNVYFETKLCADDKLYEAVWDLLKLALLTALSEPAVGYLVYAAPEAGWNAKTDRPTAIFDDGRTGVVELLCDRCANPWRWCLDGTKTARPTSLPAHVATERIGRVRVGTPNGAWEVRCVRVKGDISDGWVRFGGDGWPLADQRPPDRA
jgi:hypothetical protein